MRLKSKALAASVKAYHRAKDRAAKKPQRLAALAHAKFRRDARRVPFWLSKRAIEAMARMMAVYPAWRVADQPTFGQ